MPIETSTPTNPNSTRPARPRVAVVLAGGLLVIVVFEAALTLGAPLGAAALGGTHPGRLPDALRLATGAGGLVWLVAALIVLARGGRALVPVPEAISRVGTWVVVGLLGVGVLANLASTSPWERFGWAPYTLALLALGIVVARSASTGRTRTEVSTATRRG